MGEPLPVRWVQALALPVEWELEFQAALERFDREGKFVRLSQEEADVYVIAYPASAHADLEQNDHLYERIRDLPLVDAARVALFACDRSRPRIRSAQVSALLDHQFSAVGGHRHAKWLPAPSLLEQELQSLLQASLRGASMWNEYMNRGTDAAADSSYEAEVWEEFQ